MVFKDIINDFIVSKSYLIDNLSFFRKKRSHVIPKTFVVSDPTSVKILEYFLPCL